MNGLTLLLTGAVLLGAVALLLSGGQTMPFWILTAGGTVLLTVLWRGDKKHRPRLNGWFLVEIALVAIVVAIAARFAGGVFEVR